MSVETVLTPLSDRAQELTDALEARISKLPYKVSADTGARTYSLPSEADAQEFDRVLDEIDPAWREHLTRTE